MALPVIVPLDGEPGAEHAVPVAASIARRLDTPVTLVRAHGTVYGKREAEVAPMEEYLRDVAERIRTAKDVEVGTLLLEGHTERVLCDYIAGEGGTLTVIATKPKGAIERFFQGSVVEALIRDTHVPLLLVRPAGEAVQMADERNYAHILIPVDGSRESAQVVESLLGAGLPRGARCTLLHVRETPTRMPPAPEHLSAGDAETYLESIAAELRGAAGSVSTVVLEGSAPAKEIKGFATDHDVDLLALSTHGRGGITKLLFGSSAKTLVQEAGQDLFIHRPHAWDDD